MKRRSLRGQIGSLEEKQIIVDDGLFTHGYKIVEFYVWAQDQASGNDPQCYLAKGPGAGSKFSAQDARQIAWAGMSTTAGTRLMDFAIIDPNHIVVQDLFIKNIDGLASGVANYLIVIEPVNLTEQEGVLQLIKERSQNDL